jgi:signal transduction histidine kinase
MFDTIVRSDPLTRELFTEAFDALFLIEDDGRVIESSERARTLEAVGIGGFFVGDASDAQTMRSELRTRGRCALEIALGSRAFTVEGKSVADGRHLVVVRDVTDLRAMQEELAQLRRLDSLGRVTGGVVHDFNNVLQPIVVLAGLLEDSVSRGTPAAMYANELREAAGRAASLVHHLLGFLRDTPGRPEIFEPNRVVAEIAPLLKRLLGHDAELALDLGDLVGTVHADPEQLERMLLNLVANAREAMPRGGRVTIATSLTDLDADAAKALDRASAGRYVTLRVRDTGEGMDRATRERILEGSFSTKGPGRGNGLASARSFALAHGGAVAVESAAGQGTTIAIHLPRAGDAPVSSAPPPRSSPRGGSETILVVEADAAIRRVLRFCLENKGYKVFEATNAERLRALSNREIDLAIVDLGVGEELAQAVRASAKRVVLTTAGPIARPPFRAPLLQKTFTPRTLAMLVRSTLDAR